MKRIHKGNGKRNTTAGLLLMLALLFTLPLNASAGKERTMVHPVQSNVENERFVLDFDNSYFLGKHGGGSTLHLKRVFKQQYPGVDVSDYRLKKLVLLAKTKFGKGEAQLRVGPEVSDVYRVNGRPNRFHDDRKKTFDKVKISNPYSGSWGPWQLQLRGIFKISKVVLVAEKRKRHHYGRMPHDKSRPYFRNSTPYDGHFYFNMLW